MHECSVENLSCWSSGHPRSTTTWPLRDEWPVSVPSVRSDTSTSSKGRSFVGVSVRVSFWSPGPSVRPLQDRHTCPTTRNVDPKVIRRSRTVLTRGSRVTRSMRLDLFQVERTRTSPTSARGGPGPTDAKSVTRTPTLSEPQPHPFRESEKDSDPSNPCRNSRVCTIEGPPSSLTSVLISLSDRRSDGESVYVVVGKEPDKVLGEVGVFQGEGVQRSDTSPFVTLVKQFVICSQNYIPKSPTST